VRLPFAPATLGHGSQPATATRPAPQSPDGARPVRLFVTPWPAGAALDASLSAQGGVRSGGARWGRRSTAISSPPRAWGLRERGARQDAERRRVWSGTRNPRRPRPQTPRMQAGVQH